MNIVQQILNSNVKTGGTSSRFKFASRSQRFSTGSSESATNFSEELRRQLSSASSRNAISFESDRGRSTAIRDEGSNREFLRDTNKQNGFSNDDASAEEFGLQPGSESTGQPQSDRGNSSSPSPKNSFAVDGSSTETLSGSRGAENSGENNDAGLSEKERQLLKKLEKGEIDLSDEEEVGRLKKLLESVAGEESNPRKTRAVMKSLQELFSEPSKILQQLQGQNAEELKSSVEGLKKLLQSFKKVATESREQTTEAISEQIKNVLKQLGLEKSGSRDEQGQRSEPKPSGSSVTLEFGQSGSSDSSSGSSSSGGESSPTETLKKTLGKVIDGLEKLSKKLTGGGDGSTSLSSGEAVEKIKSFLESIKKTLNGSGQSSEDGSGKGFLSRQAQQVIDELDRTIQDEELRKKIKSRLEKVRGSTEQKTSSKQQENGTNNTAASKDSSSSESDGSTTSDSEKSSSSEKNTKKEKSKQSKSTRSSTEASTKQADQSSKQTSGNTKAAQDPSKTESASRSGQGSEDASERTAKTSQSENATSKEQRKGDQKVSRGSDSKSSSTQSKSSNGPTPTAEAVKEKASESSNQKNENITKSSAKGGSNASDKNSQQGKKVKTAAVKNQPDKAESTSKPSGQSKQSSETSKLKTSEQSFKSSEKQVQQASRAKDVVVDKGDVKRDEVRTKAANSRTDKLASFETNSARAVDASEQSGTSFSNGGNSNGNSGNLSANVKSQVASYTQRSPEARKMINQIVERAQTMLKDGKQSMRMQLQPESLGEVKLEVSIEANKVSARFKVENSSVKKTLNGSMEQLKQSLQQMGLDVDGVEVSDMSTEEGGQDEQWFDEPGENGRGRGPGGNGEEAEEGAVDEETQRRRRLREYSTIELVA